MRCMECSKGTRVIDTEKKGRRVVRRRVCGCGERFTTVEVPLGEWPEAKAEAIVRFREALREVLG